MKKILSVFLAIALFCTLLPTAMAAAPENRSLRATVQDNGDVLTVGNTRADLAYAIWWMAGCPEPTTAENYFYDLASDHVSFKAILWVVEQGIMGGTGAGTFSPDKSCTRAQTVSWLWAAASKPEPAEGTLPYTDAAQGAWYYKALLWAFQQTYIDLIDDGVSFRPNEELSGITVRADEEAEGGFLVELCAHEWGAWSITTPATEEEDGEQSHTCSVCGKTETQPYSWWDYQFYLYYNPWDAGLVFLSSGDETPTADFDRFAFEGWYEYAENEPVRLLIDPTRFVRGDVYDETGGDVAASLGEPEIDPEQVQIYITLYYWNEKEEAWWLEDLVKDGVDVSDMADYADGILSYTPDRAGGFQLNVYFSEDEYNCEEFFYRTEECPVMVSVGVWGLNGWERLITPEGVSETENAAMYSFISGKQVYRYRVPLDTETLTLQWPENQINRRIEIWGGGNYLRPDTPVGNSYTMDLNWYYTDEGYEDEKVKWYDVDLDFANYDWWDKDGLIGAGYNSDFGAVFYSLGEDLPTADAEHYLKDCWWIGDDAMVSFAPDGEIQPVHLLLDNTLQLDGDVFDETGEISFVTALENDGNIYVDARYVDENGDWYDGPVLDSGEIVKDGWTFENNILSYTPTNHVNIELSVWWCESDYEFDHFGGTEECPVVVNVNWYGWFDENAVPVPEGVSEENYIADWSRMRLRVPMDAESVTFTWNGDLVNVSYDDMFEEYTWLDVVPEGDSYTLYLDNIWEDESPWDWYNIAFNFVDEWNSMFRLDYNWGDYVIYGAIDETPEATAVAAWMGFEDYSYWNDGKPGEINLLIDLNHRIDGDVWDEEGRIEVVDCWHSHDEGYAAYIVGHLTLPNGEWYEGLIVEDGVAVVDGVTFENNLLKFTPQRGERPWIQVYASRAEYELDTFYGSDEEKYPVPVELAVFGHVGEIELPEGVLPENAIVREYCGRSQIRYWVDEELASITLTWPEGAKLEGYDLLDDWADGPHPEPEGNSLTLPLNGGGYYANLWFEDGEHDWSDWTETVAPTCTEKGEESRTCTVCGETETREVEALGHDFGDWTQTKAPACTVKGEERRDCSRCDAYETREIPALGHDLSGWDLAEAPTCTEKGLEIRGCLRCEYTEEREVPALGHNFVDGSCTRCGEKDPDYKPDTPQPPAENPFVDVAENAYYFEPVMWAVNAGVTGGVDATHFGPNKPCTRAQVVTFLYAAAGRPAIAVSEGTGDDVGPENPFEDVSERAYYHDAVLWAFGNGITGGVDKTHFGPNKTCTRAQVVTFLYSWKGKPAYTATENPFDDVAKTAYYYDAVMWAVENGVTGGTGPRTFSPNKSCTRCQVVTFLFKAK